MNESSTGDHVRMENIRKTFGGLAVLSDATFSARAGEVHGLMGENGAGKSTLMKILSGAYSRDGGDIRIAGELADIHSPRSAHRHGISIIYQEFSLAKHMSVAENILIEELGSGWLVDRKAMALKAHALLSEIGFGHIDVQRPVAELPIAYQQIVEICKALSRKSSVLILDEPTAVLTRHETEQLFSIVRDLRARGVCIIYISHRLEEIFSLCDRVTVLKDGQVTGSHPISELTEDRLVRLMIGREISDFFPPRHSAIGSTVLSVRNLNAGSLVRNISFDLRAGEILGFSGLVGAGRTEAMRALFGADVSESGEIVLDGKPLAITRPRHAIEAGIGMLPEDRKHQGVLLDLSIQINALLSPRNPYANRLGRLDLCAERAAVVALARDLNLKAASLDASVSTLSGGNQQKVALMKWIASKCRVLILDEPTRGVDVGAKVEIYSVINALAAEGVGIIMISSEMLEIIGMSDRAIVMRMGEIKGELSGKEIVEEKLIELAMGVV
ncbi:sugar ABC transporter ATP-binding protein [Ensifer sp. YR511]|uniref:sugar ABC transporter ATP-binding protein n=1 Tax=Ensifer sp. YR511 TaxID=1855294 RepID=UPI00087E6443|nr:sugar ABC transporter ATP-binding protein [Ensifer sp. YR511]SDN03579.1 ribose transport system ATP-binding protein [Ensifer sp. YR511]